MSASRDQTLKVWDREHGEVVRTLAGHTNVVNAVALMPDGKRAVSASQDGTVRIWDLEWGALLRTLEGHTAGVWEVVLTQDGKRAISASADRTVTVWNLELCGIVATFSVDSTALTVAAAPDGHTIVAGDVEGRVHFLRFENAS